MPKGMDDHATERARQRAHRNRTAGVAQVAGKAHPGVMPVKAGKIMAKTVKKKLNTSSGALGLPGSAVRTRRGSVSEHSGSDNHPAGIRQKDISRRIRLPAGREFKVGDVGEEVEVIIFGVVGLPRKKAISDRKGCDHHIKGFHAQVGALMSTIAVSAKSGNTHRLLLAQQPLQRRMQVIVLKQVFKRN